MIRNWQEHALHLDFSHIDVPQGHPSDIDMWYVTSDGFLIIGEIKNQKGTFTRGQKSLLASLVDGHRGGGTVLYIIHDHDVHMGDSVVDVSQCLVQEYYWRGEWLEPQVPITVNNAIKELIIRRGT